MSGSTDLNAYFKRFYPADRAEKLEPGEYDYCWLRYRGEASTIFPHIVCKDGFSLSAQGHFGAYSWPRDDFADSYSRVEIGYPSAREERLMPYVGNAEAPTETVYGSVPVSLVEEIIDSHGGIDEWATLIAHAEARFRGGIVAGMGLTVRAAAAAYNEQWRGREGDEQAAALQIVEAAKSAKAPWEEGGEA